ncbi:MAG: threonine/serine exporter family protein [Fusobacteriaceae bacterium]
MMTIFIRIISAFLVSVCFGTIFSLKGKKLFFAGVSGGVGWFAYEVFKFLNFSDPASYFLASVAITFSAEIIAKKLNTTVTVSLIPGLIPLVPGGGIYYTLFYLLHKNISSATEKGLESFILSGSLAFGILFVTTIFGIISKIKKLQKITKKQPK